MTGIETRGTVTIATERPGSRKFLEDEFLEDASDDARRVEPLRAEDVLTASAAWRRRSSSARGMVATSDAVPASPDFDRDAPRDRPDAADAE